MKGHINTQKNGQVKRFTYGNGQIYQSQQNTLQQTSRVFVQKPNTAWSVDLNYTYDGNGRVLTVDDGIDVANDRTYTYDGLGRLDTAVSPLWGTASYGYNAMGDLLTKSFTDWNGVSGANRTVTNSYDTATNRLTQSVDSLSGTRLVKYDNESVTDKRGNITTLGGIGFTYDMADQPITLSGSSSGSYAYEGPLPWPFPVSIDSQDRLIGFADHLQSLKRVKSTVNGVTRYNVYHHNSNAAQRGCVRENALATMCPRAMLAQGAPPPSNRWRATPRLHGAGMTLARIRTDGSGNGVFTYLHPDHLGSPKAGTKEDGTIAFTEQYTPFGETLLNPAANDNQSGFTGHIKDIDTGLNYMQARYYDPNIGRFLSIDPVTFTDTGQPGMFNRYAYTFNDPVNFIDPTGMIREGSGWANGEFEKYKSEVASAASAEGLQTASDLRGLANSLENGSELEGNDLEYAERITEAYGGDALTSKNVYKIASGISKAAKAISPESSLVVNRSAPPSKYPNADASWNGKAITIYDNGVNSTSTLLHEGGHATGGKHYGLPPTIGPDYHRRSNRLYRSTTSKRLRQQKFSDPGYWDVFE